MPDNEAYWQQRHEAKQGSLLSVGHIGRSESENWTLYAEKKRTIVNLLRHLGLIDLVDMTALDIGCGIGAISELLYALGANVSGVDASEIAVREAADKSGGDESSFIASSILDYEFDVEFNLTLCLDVLYHIIDDDNWAAAVTRMFDHTKRLGYAVIIDQIQQEPQRPAEHVRFRTLQMYADLTRDLNVVDCTPPGFRNVLIFMKK